MKARHRYVVEATRRVHAREYGPEAYQLAIKRTEFPFGAGHKLKTGQQALEAARSLAEQLIPMASAVALVKWNGNGGVAHYIKDERELFETGWADPD